MTRNNLYLIGSGDFSYEVADYILHDKNYQNFYKKISILEFVLDNNKLILKKKREFDKKNDFFLITVSNSLIREIIYKNFIKKNSYKLTKFIHKSAEISKNSRISQGNIIAPFVQISNNSVIGKCNIINSHCVVGHDAKISNFCNISPGAKILGHAQINKHVMIGSNSTIGQGVKIRYKTKISSNLFINKNISNNKLIYSNDLRQI